MQINNALFYLLYKTENWKGISKTDVFVEMLAKKRTRSKQFKLFEYYERTW